MERKRNLDKIQAEDHLNNLKQVRAALDHQDQINLLPVNQLPPEESVEVEDRGHHVKSSRLFQDLTPRAKQGKHLGKMHLNNSISKASKDQVAEVVVIEDSNISKANKDKVAEVVVEDRVEELLLEEAVEKDQANLSNTSSHNWVKISSSSSSSAHLLG